MRMARLTQDDLDLQRRNDLTKVPSSEMLERGRQFFKQQAQECRSLAGSFPEMMAAAEKFERWSILPDAMLMHHWPLARAEVLRRKTVREEMRSSRREALEAAHAATPQQIEYLLGKITWYRSLQDSIMDHLLDSPSDPFPLWDHYEEKILALREELPLGVDE